MELSDNARTVLEKRYLRKDKNGKPIESVEELLRRVAANIAEAERFHGASESDIKALANEFYQMMDKKEFMPNSPTLMNAGRELQQLSACFVLPVEDTMESIFDTLKYAALIHKSGGGTGFAFSRIRPKNDVVLSTMGVSSGPISFMKVYNAATEAIKQGGTRRGANMGILRVDHPDIMDFITCKEEERNLANFNISVAVTKEFMEALKEGESYPLVNPRTRQEVARADAKEVWEKVVGMAWKTGDPGVIFLDKVNEANPTPDAGEIESTNPCGEQPLLPFESCNLGSINLVEMVNESGKLDWEKMRKVVRTSVHFLDNVIDMNNYPLKQIEKNTKANRKIGLGVMGWADMLIQMGIPYNSEKALELAEKIMKFIQEEGYKKSEELAEEKGVFPNWRGSVFDHQGKKMRNATITTIAPTGTISIIAGASSGIEPLFAVAFVRNVLDGERLIDVNPTFKRIALDKDFYSEKLMEAIVSHGTIQDIIEIPDSIKRMFVTAHDINPEWHVRMQAAFQKYTDNAVSKTVNLPHSASEENVKYVYELAYDLECKGVTIYRDKCKSAQVIEVGVKEEGGEPVAVEAKAEKPGVLGIRPRERPAMTTGATVKTRTGCGNLYVTINEDKKGIAEVFSRMGKSGGCAASQSEAIGRLVSLALRSFIDPEEVINQLRGIRCPRQIVTPEGPVYSCPDAISKSLEKYLDKTRNIQYEKNDLLSDSGEVPECPECGAMVYFQEGCLKCPSCGWSRC